jgi:hypothetical protein
VIVIVVLGFHSESTFQDHYLRNLARGFYAHPNAKRSKPLAEADVAFMKRLCGANRPVQSQLKPSRSLPPLEPSTSTFAAVPVDQRPVIHSSSTSLGRSDVLPGSSSSKKVVEIVDESDVIDDLQVEDPEMQSNNDANQMSDEEGQFEVLPLVYGREPRQRKLVIKLPAARKDLPEAETPQKKMQTRKDVDEEEDDEPPAKKRKIAKIVDENDDTDTAVEPSSAKKPVPPAKKKKVAETTIEVSFNRALTSTESIIFCF